MRRFARALAAFLIGAFVSAAVVGCVGLSDEWAAHDRAIEDLRVGIPHV